MIRLWRIGKFGFFKRFRLAGTLLKASVSLVFFQHYRYFIFCFLLSLVQFLTFVATGFIHSKLKISLIVSELLAGLNFFEILFESINNIKPAQLGMGAIILCIELFFIFCINSAVAWYSLQHTEQKKIECKQYYHLFLTIWPSLAWYALIETAVLFITALMGWVGSILYFLWQWGTIFMIQIITFEKENGLQAIKKSFNNFTKNIAHVVSIDILYESVLIAGAFLLYFITQQTIAKPMGLAKLSYGASIVLLYLLSILYVLETVTFTLLYMKLKKERI
ncbi:MAG: hypothetical protein AMXMBFR12_00720 [Candidatus Babeliales bacterium]